MFQGPRLRLGFLGDVASGASRGGWMCGGRMSRGTRTPRGRDRMPPPGRAIRTPRGPAGRTPQEFPVFQERQGGQELQEPREAREPPRSPASPTGPRPRGSPESRRPTVAGICPAIRICPAPRICPATRGRWRACAERRHACTGGGGEAVIKGGAGIKYRQHARGNRGSRAAGTGGRGGKVRGTYVYACGIRARRVRGVCLWALRWRAVRRERQGEYIPYTCHWCACPSAHRCAGAPMR